MFIVVLFIMAKNFKQFVNRKNGEIHPYNRTLFSNKKGANYEYMQKHG